MTITVELAPGLAAWSYGDTTLNGGRHDVDVTGDTDLAEAICCAAAAGSLTIIGDPPESMAIVESDETSLAKYQAAQTARAPLYAERDAELATTRDPDERDAIVEKYERLMAAAAQQAAELNDLAKGA